MDTGLESKLNLIYAEKINKITPENIKNGVNIFNITGNLIPANHTNLDVILSTSSQNLTPNSPYNGFNVVNIPAVTASIDNNITAENIKTGVNILNIQGTYTSDATALVTDISNGKTAYVNGQKITGTLDRKISYSTNVTSISNAAANKIAYVALTPNEPTIFNANSMIFSSASYDQLAPVIDLQPNKLKSGENILGVAGTVDEIKIYNSYNEMLNDNSAIANHSYGIEVRNSTTYTPINYNVTVGCQCLNILNSFTNTASRNRSLLISDISFDYDFDFYNSGISINSTNAFITIIGENNECLLDAQYTSLDGVTYNLSSISGTCLEDNNTKFYCNLCNVQTIRFQGDIVPTYYNDFDCFWKPVEKFSTGPYNGALYKYDGTNWNTIFDVDTINNSANPTEPETPIPYPSQS